MSPQNINCPDCGTKIPLDINLLLQGKSFPCPKCSIEIQLQSNSVDTVKSAMSSFEALKSHPLKSK